VKITTARDGTKTGEWDVAGLQAALERGEVLPSDLVWIPGWEGWKVLSSVVGEVGVEAPVSAHPPPLPSQPSDEKHISEASPPERSGVMFLVFLVSYVPLIAFFTLVIAALLYLFTTTFNDAPLGVVLTFCSFVYVALFIYFAPAGIAAVRDHPQFWPIMILNVVGGWSGVAWLVALIWCLYVPRRDGK